FGKAMANGFPLAAVVGRREIMEIFDEIFFSVTFGGEALSLAAAQATMAKLREKNVIEHLWRQGARLRDGYNALAREGCLGYPPRTVLTFTDGAGAQSLAMKSLLQQEMIKRGILIAGGFNLCYAHSDDDIRRTLEACRDALAILARAFAESRVEASLEGPVIQPVFRSA
ncbi:MAG: aminotransferase class III-fold pyridoxal phosphate-dependent enzyme, partial [Actinobacteria bacterium]